MATRAHGRLGSLFGQEPSEAVRTVMIVEDADDVRDGLTSVFEMEGYRVVPVRHGRAALDALSTLRHQPDVAIVDLVMPKMDGLTFRELQTKLPRIADMPAIALTAHEGLRRHALSIGFNAVLLKPCDMKSLLSLVAQHSRPRRALRRA